MDRRLRSFPAPSPDEARFPAPFPAISSVASSSNGAPSTHLRRLVPGPGRRLPGKMPDHEIDALKAMIDGHGFVRLPEAPPAPVRRKIAIGAKVKSRPVRSAGCRDFTPASRRASASSSCSMFSAVNARSRSLQVSSCRNEGSHAVDQGGAHRIARRDRHDAGVAGQHPRASGSMARAANFEAQRTRSSSPCALAGAPGQGPRR